MKKNKILESNEILCGNFAQGTQHVDAGGREITALSIAQFALRKEFTSLHLKSFEAIVPTTQGRRTR